MKFLEISEPIYLEDLIKVEDELNIKFSSDFKEHYIEYNGGYPERDLYPWNDTETTTINTFFSIKYKGFGNVESTYKDLVILEQYLLRR